jgi:hypothetical protein
MTGGRQHVKNVFAIRFWMKRRCAAYGWRVT